MADQNLGGSTWPPEPNNKPIGTGEGEVPLTTPPNPKIDLRTMASDLNSLKETGGGAPRPYTPPPQAIKPETTPAPAAFPTSAFEPTKMDSSSMPPVQFPGPISPAKSKRGLFFGLLTLIIVLGLGAAGYFYVYPRFFASAPAVATPSAPVSQPTLPAANPATPEVTTTVTPAPQTQLGIQNHVSLFKTAADTTVNANLSSSDLTGFRTALPFVTADVTILKEVVLKDAKGSILNTSQILLMLLPDALSSDVLSSFNPDATFFIYADKTGSWPGIILAAGANASLTDLQSKVGALEASTKLANLFLTDPGTAGPGWKSGTTSNVTNRYLTFSKSGFALNYGWVGQNLLISTSYNGFKEAIKRLQ